MSLNKVHFNQIIALSLAVLLLVVACIGYFLPIYPIAKYSFAMAATGSVLGFSTFFIGVLKG
ncbi:hypothetical protein ACPV5U_19175 [Vibrio mediterranei]